jgi:hypothetical protein
MTMQDKKAARLDKRTTRKDKTRQDKIKQNETRLDKKDKTRQDSWNTREDHHKTVGILEKTISRHGKKVKTKKRPRKDSKLGFDSRLRGTSTDAFSRFGFDSNAPMDSKRRGTRTCCDTKTKKQDVRQRQTEDETNADTR